MITTGFVSVRVDQALPASQSRPPTAGYRLPGSRREGIRPAAAGRLLETLVTAGCVRSSTRR